MSIPNTTSCWLYRSNPKVIGEFLDTSEFQLCRWDDVEKRYHPVMMPIEAILAAHFGIDLVKLDDEKRAMIDTIRMLNNDD